MRYIAVSAISALFLLSAGCHSGTWFKGFDGKGWNVSKTYTKVKGGPEFREDKAGYDSNRWSSQIGLGAEMDNGHKFAITYRRRDIDNGIGSHDGHDNGVWVEWQIPIWNAPKKKSASERELERRIAALEHALSQERSLLAKTDER